MTRAANVVRWIWRHKFVSLAIVTLTLVVVSSVFATLLAPFDLFAVDLGMRNQPPFTPDPEGGIHLLGTDALGRDVLSRLMLGGRVSLSVGVTSVVVSGTFGTVVGVLAGFYRGWFEELVMRLVDLQLSIPSLLIALLTLYILGPSFFNVVLVLALVRWMVYARVARGLTITLREQLFVEAARSLGASSLRIVLRHLIPNLLAPVLVLATLDLAVMLLTEASLSFLGLGIQPPDVSWGLMLAEGKEYMTSAWWLVAAPGTTILLTTLSVNIIATYVRAATSASTERGWRSQSVTMVSP